MATAEDVEIEKLKLANDLGRYGLKGTLWCMGCADGGRHHHRCSNGNGQNGGRWLGIHRYHSASHHRFRSVRVQKGLLDGRQITRRRLQNQN